MKYTQIARALNCRGSWPESPYRAELASQIEGMERALPLTCTRVSQRRSTIKSTEPARNITVTLEIHNGIGAGPCQAAYTLQRVALLCVQKCCAQVPVASYSGCMCSPPGRQGREKTTTSSCETEHSVRRQKASRTNFFYCFWAPVDFVHRVLQNGHTP
eukprot:6206976-Pleurochrysis_carterae.AAC.4